MTALIGVLGALLGAIAGTLGTYIATRTNMQLALSHTYDQTLQSKRLEHYQKLFHISRCFPRYWRPGEAPSREDLRDFIQTFHNWYFGEEAGGMFLSPNSKQLYIGLLNAIAEACYANQPVSADTPEPPLTDEESLRLRTLASELRHQLAEDVGTANPPHFRWTRLPRPAPPPPGTADSS